jgi:hypothetical protein
LHAYSYLVWPTQFLASTPIEMIEPLEGWHARI